MRLVSLALLSALTLASVPSASAQATPAPPAKPAYLSDPQFVAAMDEAKQLEKKRQYVFAIDAYKKANKIASGACANCVQKIYTLQYGLRDFKAAAQTATQLAALVTNPADKSTAQGERGSALLAEGGDKPKPAQLDAAHQAFELALTADPKNTNARYYDGCTLARMGKTDEASKQFASCSEALKATDPMRLRAQHFAENPALSMAKMAPAFEVTALDGSRFTLDNMGGRVVLIDFWATWCGPCNAELPHMQKIAKEFAGQPLVIISISWDSDEQKWKDFVAKHEMTWTQYRDADHKLSEEFGVNAIPHYFTIDSDGVLTAEMMGSGSDVEGKLKKLIKRAREAQPASTEVVAQTGGN